MVWLWGLRMRLAECLRRLGYATDCVSLATDDTIRTRLWQLIMRLGRLNDGLWQLVFDGIRCGGGDDLGCW